ncbi:CAP domain-containing protein [Streptomyces sp. NPDC059861]|uniref:CAP domain-containing protein n=1 Tax=Streptomyces sp. NPDC059861 TaxID=3346974 RepID=UPI003651D5F3
MGRHRRSAAGRATTGDHETHGSDVGGLDPQHSHDAGPARGIAPYLNPEAYAETVSKSEAYLFAPDRPHAPVGAHAGAASSDTAAFPVADGYRHHSPSFGDHGQAGYTSGGYGHDGYGSGGHGHDGLGPDAYGHDGLGPERYGPGGRSPEPHGLGGYGPDGPSLDGGSGHGSSRRRKKKNMAPVRNGLLGVSAAVAIGTVAVATGVLPGSDTYTLGGGGAEKVQVGDSPSNTESQQGGTSGTAEAGSREGSPSTSRDAERSTSPSASTPSARPTTKAPARKAPSKKPSATPSTKKPAPKPTPSRTPSKVPTQQTTPPVTISPETAVETEVLRLVNNERAQAGCSPLAANSALADLAGDYSEAMAEQGFFDHTDPSGNTPWDRAEAAGISNLGGENIARGQADAAAVMEAWMNSPGHRANILNCDFKTLGVGVHYGSGGPWWTQNFGY